MIRKNISFLIIMTLCLLITSGCKSQKMNESKDEIKLGTYISDEDSTSDINSSQIHLGEDGKFTLSRNIYDSNIILGTYKIENNTLTLNEENGNSYLFKIKDDKLTFQKESSSDLSLNDKLEFHLKTDK